MDKVDKLINLIRLIKEEGMGVSSGPVNATNKSGEINIAGLPPDTPPVFKKNKNYAKGGRGSRKWWLQYLRGN